MSQRKARRKRLEKKFVKAYVFASMVGNPDDVKKMTEMEDPTKWPINIFRSVAS